MFSLLTCSGTPKQTAAGSWSGVLASLAPQIRNASRRTAFPANVSERDLYKQLLLHLPRLSWDDLVDPQYVAREAERLAEMLLRDRGGFESWADQPKVRVLDKPDATVRACEPEVAREIHERFHYIRSYHPGRVHLALYLQSHPRIPAALASISSMDIKHLDWLFASADEKERVLVLTRLFAFDWAPRNSISYLLGQVCRWTKRNLPKVTTLLTYINPNLGFTGSSFLAANWRPFLEKPVAYSYFQDTYITHRRLSSLPASALTRVTRSLYELEALKILRYEMSEEHAPLNRCLC
jgi:hypothetical protein